MCITFDPSMIKASDERASPRMTGESDRAQPPLRNVTELLHALGAGDRSVLEELLPLVYDELNDMARRRLRQERAGHTLNTSDLVHEAYLRLADQQRVQWQSRSHFFAVAAQAMRRVLVNYAEQHRAQKRGGGRASLPLSAIMTVPLSQADFDPDLLDLHDALSRLEAFNERGSRVVEYRYFGGMTYEEIAEVLGTSPVTVRRAWTAARLWLRRELQADGAKGETS